MELPKYIKEFMLFSDILEYLQKEYKIKEVSEIKAIYDRYQENLTKKDLIKS
jgi:hypothetical protein